MIPRIGLALVFALGLGVGSASGQDAVDQRVDSLAAVDSESRFGASWVLGTLGSVAGTFVGGAIGYSMADHVGEFAGLGEMILGGAIGGSLGSGLLAAVGAQNSRAWPYLGAAIGCVGTTLILWGAEGDAWLLYFPIQGLAAAAFAQIGR